MKGQRTEHLGSPAARNAYRGLCEAEDTVPLFSQAWLLDALHGDAWSAVISRGKDGRPLGALPFVWDTKRLLVISSAHPLVPRLGPWLHPSLATHGSTGIAKQHKVLGELAEGVPDFDHFSQAWNPDLGDWLSFKWKGFSQTLGYTYRVDLDDPDDMWPRMDGVVRTEVRKARGRYGLECDTTMSLTEFHSLNAKVFARQALSTPYLFEQLRKFDDAVSAHARRVIVAARDAAGTPHAACYVVHNHDTAYYLLGGSDPALRSSGAGYFVLWEAMRQLVGSVRTFDFEGSMLPGVEPVFRAFGTEQTPYHIVTRTPSRLIRLALEVRGRG